MKIFWESKKVCKRKDFAKAIATKNIHETTCFTGLKCNGYLIMHVFSHKHFVWLTIALHRFMKECNKQLKSGMYQIRVLITQ